MCNRLIVGVPADDLVEYKGEVQLFRLKSVNSLRML